ncbi:MAG: PAS domain S-box protein [Rhodobiaceae bacterium]|nr:PAS domain S-box protein [Rhodobiaceae bacterium]MCC0015519.1 PAS domain S-box protein [Rhodobiaceae bacterium]MCC0040915.1 PAS domain S-box protein [Rhodobiaceae bacterium]MCC0053242.1 PAS domain S-box protein [Rhodobiaceae bacterium]
MLHDTSHNAQYPFDEKSGRDVSVSVLKDLTISDANHAFCELVRLPRLELLGRSFNDLTQADSAIDALRRLGRSGIDDCIARFETTVMSGPEARIIEWNAATRPGSDGFVREFFLDGRDVTENRSYQAALHSLVAIGQAGDIPLESRIPEILGIAHRYFGMRFGVLNRIEGNTVVVERLADLTGELYEGQRIPLSDTYCGHVIGTDSIVAITDLTQTPLSTKECFRRIPLGSLLATPIRVAGRLYGALQFGDTSIRERPFTGEQLDLLSLSGQWVSYELAAQLRARQLESGERRYRNLYRHTPVMMHSLDWNGRLVEVSDTWLETLGYSRDEVIGHQPTEFMTEESRLKAIIESLPANLQHPDWRREPYVMRRKDGTTIDVELSAVSNWDDLEESGVDDAALARFMALADGNRYEVEKSEVTLCVLVDVTERNQAQRSSVQANASLMRANEGLKRFNLIASHDLQEPLRKIRAFASILGAELNGEVNGDARYALDAIGGASQRLSNLVEDLLAYTRQSNEGFEFETVDLEDLIRRGWRAVATDLSFPEDAFTIASLPVVRAGRIPLERLVCNLLTNAVKYRDPSRTLACSVRVDPDAGQQTVDIIFRDNGIGIPENQIERIFEPFHRLCTRQEVPGSGIGLAICHMVAQKHGWQLTARAAPEHGTEFVLRIPATDVIAPAPPLTFGKPPAEREKAA